MGVFEFFENRIHNNFNPVIKYVKNNLDFR